MAPRVVDKDEKRRRIAAAALQVFGEKGFDRTRMADVASLAQVGKGTLYEYYPDKDSLFQGAFTEMMHGFLEKLAPVLESDAPALDLLAETAHRTVREMIDVDHIYPFFLEYLLFASRRPEANHVMAEVLTDYRAMTAALLERAAATGAISPEADVEMLAAVFAAWFDGAILHWVVIPGGPEIEKMADSFIEMFFRGLGAGKGGEA
ncbi:MAG: TetR/AcrR family transcriptional regulator [Polyangia bacterium]